MGPCYYNPQGLGHVWGPQLPAPHDYTLLYQCEHATVPHSPWGRGSRWERRNGEGPWEKPGLGFGAVGVSPWGTAGQSMRLLGQSHRAFVGGDLHGGDSGLGRFARQNSDGQVCLSTPLLSHQVCNIYDITGKCTVSRMRPTV